MLDQLLSKNELIHLGKFLEEGEEKGWLGLTALHGFLCALITGPHLIPPSEWHVGAFGEEGLEFSSQEEAQEIMMLMSRLNNHIIYQLGNHITCEPILYDKGQIIDYKNSEEQLARWCAAYIEGTRFDGTWHEEESAVCLLLPFAVLSNEFSLVGDKDDEGNIINDDSKQRMNFIENIPLYMQELYELWLSLREYAGEENEYQRAYTPYERPTEKIGRNELCPCGSGKKYKKCCLDSEGVTYH